MSEFIPGLELSRLFYWEIVRPILYHHYPGLSHAAALIGPGSEVLGFDTEMSMDHHWFPRVQIFLQDIDKELGAQIHEILRWKFPPTFMNFPLHLEEIPDEPGVYLMVRKDGPHMNTVFIHKQFANSKPGIYVGMMIISSLQQIGLPPRPKFYVPLPAGRSITMT